MIKATQCPGNNGSRVKNERLTKSGTEGKGLKSQTHPPSLRRVGVRKYSAGKPRLKPEKTARQGHAGWPPEAQQGPGLKGQTQPPGLRRESPHGKDMDRKPPPEAAPGMAENRRKKRAAHAYERRGTGIMEKKIPGKRSEQPWHAAANSKAK